MRRAQPKSERGFTLLEVVLSLGIFSVGFVGVVGMQIVVATNARVAGDISLASNIITSRMEDWRVADYDTVVAETRYYDEFGLDLGTAVPPDFFTVVTAITEGIGADYKDVQVTASWNYGSASASRRTHQVQIISRLIR